MNETNVQAVHRELLQKQIIAPVASNEAEERAWLDCDLASMAEHHIGDLTDPRSLDQARREHWLSTALGDDNYSEPPHLRAHHTCYWLMHQGERLGSLVLDNKATDIGTLKISSFYLYPPYRGQGKGRRIMLDLMDILAQRELGLSLDASWTWQRTVRFYIKLGLWIWMWKHDLRMYWSPKTPAPKFDVRERSATISVQVNNESITLARAKKRGLWLDFELGSEKLQKDRRLGNAYLLSSGTLALSLALAGWPLIRSQNEWKRCYFADTGAPEGLARRITLWEAWERHKGWIVNTPSIPGLHYPTWDEVTAEWNATSKA